MTTTEIQYPSILERIKALFIDTFVMVTLIYFFALVFEQFEQVSNAIKVIAFVFVYLLIDPLFTHFLGGTTGHFATGIRVKHVKDESKNIAFHSAIIRFLAKTLLGVLSFAVISQNEKSRAIHDFLAGSIVVYKQ